LMFMLHQHGINMRYLGAVRSFLQKNHPRQNIVMEKFILENMFARTLKIYWRETIVDQAFYHKKSIEQACKSITLDVLNKFLQIPSDLEFQQIIYDRCTEKYSLGIEADKKLVFSLIDRKYVIQKFCKMCGISLRSEIWKNLPQSGGMELSSDLKFTPDDLVEFSTKIHLPDIFEFHFVKYTIQKIPIGSKFIGFKSQLMDALQILQKLVSRQECSLETKYLYSHTIFSLYKIDPTQFPCDLAEVNEAIYEYWTNDSDNLSSDYRFILRFEFICSYYLQKSNNDVQLNTQNNITTITKEEADRRKLLNGEWLRNRWVESPTSVLNFLDEMKVWEVDSDHSHVFDTILDVLPGDYKVELLRMQLSRYNF